MKTWTQEKDSVYNTFLIPLRVLHFRQENGWVHYVFLDCQMASDAIPPKKVVKKLDF